MNKEQNTKNKELTANFGNTVLPTVSMQYRPTYSQWKKITSETELEPHCNYDKVELIDFKTHKIHLKSGSRLSFDCLSEEQYLHVVNGGYYEDVPPINETARV